MAEKTEELSLSSKLNDTIVKFRGVLIAVIAVVLVVIIGCAVVVTVSKNATAKNIEQIDTITYNLTKDADGIEESEVIQRRDAAINALIPFADKGGISGARANILLADLLFQKKDYSASRDAWLKAASAKKAAYFTGLAYYNAGVCCENLNDIDGAIENYTKATEEKYFALMEHALFSLGRVYEGKADYENAAKAYNKLNDTNPDSSWANIAKSRLIDFKASGNIQ